MIDFLKDEPLDCTWRTLGLQLLSALFPLGADSIEQPPACAMPIFTARNISEPFVMVDTAYGRRGAQSAKRRIPGYRDGFFSGYSPADQISMSLPYAAGALVPPLTI